MTALPPEVELSSSDEQALRPITQPRQDDRIFMECIHHFDLTCCFDNGDHSTVTSRVLRMAAPSERTIAVAFAESRDLAYPPCSATPTTSGAEFRVGQDFRREEMLREIDRRSSAYGDPLRRDTLHLDNGEQQFIGMEASRCPSARDRRRSCRPCSKRSTDRCAAQQSLPKHFGGETYALLGP